MPLFRKFLLDVRASSSIEYAIIGALISIAVVVGARTIGLSIQAKFLGPVANGLS
jgi:Flp pilus assembly pilin Flp